MNQNLFFIRSQRLIPISLLKCRVSLWHWHTWQQKCVDCFSKNWIWPQPQRFINRVTLTWTSFCHHLQTGSRQHRPGWAHWNCLQVWKTSHGSFWSPDCHPASNPPSSQVMKVHLQSANPQLPWPFECLFSQNGLKIAQKQEAGIHASWLKQKRINKFECTWKWLIQKPKITWNENQKYACHSSNCMWNDDPWHWKLVKMKFLDELKFYLKNKANKMYCHLNNNWKVSMKKNIFWFCLVLKENYQNLHKHGLFTIKILKTVYFKSKNININSKKFRTHSKTIKSIQNRKKYNWCIQNRSQKQENLWFISFF